MAEKSDPAASFVAKFASHYRRCVALAKQFSIRNPDLRGSVAISHLCRASQELLEQAKAAQALTEIYLALDDKHRELIRPTMIGRFRDISNSARASWRRFRDSIQLVRTGRHEIETARSEFEPHARDFHETVQRFIALGEKGTQ